MKSKKMFLGILLFVLLFPLKAFANEYDDVCEQVNTSNEKTVEIKITHEIENREKVSEEDIGKFKFNYKILDLDDNVLAETTNNVNGDVIFHCFNVNSSDIGSYKLYKIIMEENNDTPFEYDPYIIYFSLRPRYTNGLFDPIVAYYKDDGDDSPERYGSTYKGEVFHATEEELEGQAYAVIDEETGVMTFFRDEENKYTNNQVVGSKVYYTGFEENTGGQDGTFRWNDGWISETNIIKKVKKVVFKDAIKPKNITAWFAYFENLEEIDLAKLDTSQTRSFAELFRECKKLKNVDVSTMDASNVKYIYSMFQNSGIEYVDFSNWNFDLYANNVSLAYLLYMTDNLKYFNITSFGDWNGTSDSFFEEKCVEKIVINDIFSFHSAGLDTFDSIPMWYSPLKNQMYNYWNFDKSSYTYTGGMAGYYIRPMCTTEASFKSKYISTDIPVEISNEVTIFETLKNPETGDRLLIIFLMSVVGLCVCIYFYRRKKLY